MRVKFIALLILVISIITACNLGTDATSVIPQPDTISLDTPVPDEIASDTPTTVVVATDMSNQQGNEQSIVPVIGEPSNETDVAIALASNTIEAEHFVLPGCTIQRPDWNTYTVHAGDTLTAMARNFNTTITVLAQVNCLADVNLIYVGQVLRVPPQLRLPLIDMGPFPSTTCAVIPIGTRAHIYSTGVSNDPVAILTGSIRFLRKVDNAYIVDLPDSGEMVWTSNLETELVGRSCPVDIPEPIVEPTFAPLPVIGGDGEPPADSCSVERNIGINDVSVFRDLGNGLVQVASLGTYLPFVAETEFGYEVELPGYCNETGYVWTADVHLSGRACPNAVEPPMTIPAYGNDGEPTANSCSVVRNPGIESVFIYLTPGDSFSMIGTLTNWLPFQQTIDGGYMVNLPDGNQGWISEAEASLIGSRCPIN